MKWTIEMSKEEIDQYSMEAIGRKLTKEELDRFHEEIDDCLNTEFDNRAAEIIKDAAGIEDEVEE